MIDHQHHSFWDYARPLPHPGDGSTNTKRQVTPQMFALEVLGVGKTRVYCWHLWSSRNRTPDIQLPGAPVQKLMMPEKQGLSPQPANQPPCPPCWHHQIEQRNLPKPKQLDSCFTAALRQAPTKCSAGVRPRP